MAIKPLDNDTDRVTRQPRTMDALEATYGVDDEKPEIDVEIEETTESTADAAAEAIAQQLKEKDDEIARARAETVEARRHAAEAGNTVVNAAHQAVNERAANIESAIEARNQTIESAESALKAAMDGNDPIAMSKAQRQIARAEAELVQLERDKGAVEADRLRLKNAPASRQQPEQQGPSADSRRWIVDHPRFNVDPEYQAAATAADKSFRMLYGQQDVGTQKYVDFIEKNLTARYGDNHGTFEAMNSKSQPRNGARQRPASSTAARADAGSDAGDGGANGGLTFKHAAGTISLKRTGDGKETIVGKIPPAWADAAKWSGFKQGDMIPNSGGKKYKTDAEGAHAYAIEQLHILDEQRSGSNAGLQFGEGGVLQ